jgi:hypothetical protein
VPHAVVPIIIATGLIFGGITQLAAALIQIGSGDTLNGALFATFASFWIVLPTPNGPARSPARPSPAACHPPSSPSTGLFDNAKRLRTLLTDLQDLTWRSPGKTAPSSHDARTTGTVASA